MLCVAKQRLQRNLQRESEEIQWKRMCKMTCKRHICCFNVKRSRQLESQHTLLSAGSEMACHSFPQQQRCWPGTQWPDLRHFKKGGESTGGEQNQKKTTASENKNRAKTWENKRRAGEERTETKKTTALSQTWAVLGKAKLAQSTLTDSHAHVPAQLQSLTEYCCVNTG